MARRTSDPSGAWRAGSTSGGRRVWRFYLGGVAWSEPGHWRVRGKYGSAEQALGEILLRILDTLGAGFTSGPVVPEAWRESNRPTGEHTDIGVLMDDGFARWALYFDEGGKAGPHAEDPEADLAAFGVWEDESRDAPWLRWFASEGRTVLLAGVFGVTNFDASGQAYRQSGDADPYEAAQVIACPATPLAPRGRAEKAGSAPSAYGATARMLAALRRKVEGHLWAIGVRIYIEETAEEPSSPRTKPGPHSWQGIAKEPKRKAKRRRGSSSTSKRKASGGSGAPRGKSSRASAGKGASKRSGVRAAPSRDSVGRFAKPKRKASGRKFGRTSVAASTSGSRSRGSSRKRAKRGS